MTIMVSHLIFNITGTVFIVPFDCVGSGNQLIIYNSMI